MKKFLVLIFSVFLLGIAGCTSTPEVKMSPMQIREMTTKQINGNYKTVYKAVITVLQDQDYIIENTDFEAGLIVCEKLVDKEKTANDYLMVMLVDSRHDTNSKVNVSATVTELTKNTCKVRLSIQEKTITSGTFASNEKAYNVKDPEVYKALFDQIKVEVERLKAIK